MIIAENLSFSYTGTPPFVLDGINLEVQGGEYLSILGENGCGKSTLIRLILGFHKPTSGRLAIQTKQIAYVPQKNDFSNSGFPITVFEVLHSYAKLLKLKNKSAVIHALNQVGMSDFAEALMGNLSGGQSQKILIARALLGDPKLIILDEPSTGVDVGSQKEIYGILKTINTEHGVTILSVEHNLDAAISNSTLIYHLNCGKGHLYSSKEYEERFLKIRGAHYVNF